MTINSETRVAGPFEGNDSTTVFPFTFKVFDSDELYVVRAVDAAETVLVLDTDYTVTLNPDQNAAPGGTATLAEPLATDSLLTLTSDLEALQPLDLTNQGGFYPRVINNAFDRVTILIQQLKAVVSRTLKFPLSDGPVSDLPGRADRAGRVLAFDPATAEPVAGPTIYEVETVAATNEAIAIVASNIDDVNTVADNLADVTNFADVYYGPSATDPITRRDGSPLEEGDLYFNTESDRMHVYAGGTWHEALGGSVSVQNFSGDGVETEFLLDFAPETELVTQVFVGGIYQQKNTYELGGVDGDVLVFSEAPPTGTDNIEVVVSSVVASDDILRADLADDVDPAKGAALVGYRSRTVFARLEEERSLKDFGAVGDGVADDTAAVQDAVDSGVPLFVPKGTFKLTDTIRISVSQFSMRGAGPHSRFLKSGDYGHTFLFTDPAGTAVTNDILIQDFKVEQDPAVQATNGTQIRFDACRNVWVRGVWVRNGFVGFDCTGSDQMHIDGLYIIFDVNNGGLITGRTFFRVLPTTNTGKGAHSGDVFITNSNMRCGASAFCETGFLMTAGDGIWLNNSHVGSCTAYTVRVNADNATKCTGLLMDNNWIDFGDAANGITFGGSTPTLNGNHYVRNNKVLGGTVGTHGIDIGGDATRIRITDNEVSDFKNSGIIIRSGATGEVTIKNNVVRDCSMASPGAANGITYTADCPAYITDNTITGAQHAQHINIGSTKALAVIDNNQLIGSVTGGSKMSALTGTTISQKNNAGFNPTGFAAVTVGASPFTYTNSTGYPIELVISSGGTGVSLRKNSTTFAASVTSGTFMLAPGETMQITYTTAPAVYSFGL